MRPRYPQRMPGLSQRIFAKSTNCVVHVTPIETSWRSDAGRNQLDEINIYSLGSDINSCIGARRRSIVTA